MHDHDNSAWPNRNCGAESVASNFLMSLGVSAASPSCRGYNKRTNSGVYDHHSGITMSNIPYGGDFTGFAWNSQALFAQKAQRQFQKRYKAQQLASRHDFGTFSETHGLLGRADALWLPPDIHPFWSHGTSHQGGVGLWIKNTFLSKFQNWVWVELEAGRVAVLRLSGDAGEFDIFCVYLDTNSSVNRHNSIRMIGNATRPKEQVLSIIVGDFNTVEHNEDRWNLNAGSYSGTNNDNANDAAVFKEVLREGHGFHEWDQPFFTCEAGGARSRIDRMYTNQHISYQIDRNCSCSALEWNLDLSRHRAISFARRSPAPRCVGDKPLCARVFKRKGWADEVIRDFQERCQQDTVAPSACRSLVLLKDAIRCCSQDEGMDGETVEEPLPEDDLGIIMACLKAFERKGFTRIAKLRRNCAALDALLPPSPETCNTAQVCSSLRDEAVRLSRLIITGEIQELSRSPPDDPEEKNKAKENILKKLSRLSPGENNGINAMVHRDGHVTTSPQEIAEILRDHWKGVFKEKHVELAALQIWMEDLFLKNEEGVFITGLPEVGSSRWVIRRKAIAKAVKTARNSAPGPDGIPATAYKALGPIAIDLLHQVSECLCTPHGVAELTSAYSDRCTSDLHEFNRSLLCCLPKKAVGTDPELGDFFSGDTTRPLALVNTDNRILASAARLTWEPILAEYISVQQQGFLKGRQMLGNVIDIDYAAMTVSLTCAKGATMFFDFKAAFPSVSHDFFKPSLSFIGLPPSTLSFINSIYDHNFCSIMFKGNLYEGFGMECGVRQGCPISPLLFAAAVDVLIRRLQQKIPTGHIRAFADDIGLVAEDWARDCGVAYKVFKEFASMSGLDLNIPKTVLIPLWPGGVKEARDKLQRGGSDWKDLKVTESGMYLGFKSGPGKADSSWDSPTAKFKSRVGKWREVKAGAQFATLAYNTFALSTLQFIAQLENPPAATLDAELSGLKATVGGPGGFGFNPLDYYYLKELYGQSRSFASIEVIALASKLRVMHMHNTFRRGSSAPNRASISEMNRRLRELLRNPIDLDRVTHWGGWYERSHVSCLFKAKQDLHGVGITIERCLEEIAGWQPPPWSDAVCRKQKREFQKTVVLAIKGLGRPDPVARVRAKLNRWMDWSAARPSDTVSLNWKIPGPPAWIARRSHGHLDKLSNLVPPRVASAVFKAVWNNWCTARRYQQTNHTNDKCWLGCGSHAQDSIEHYSRCPIALDVLRNKMRINLDPRRGLPLFALAMCEQDQDDVLALSALYIYGVYMCTNQYRNMLHSYGARTAEHAKQCIGQHIIQGCQGHARLTRLLDGRWDSPFFDF